MHIVLTSISMAVNKKHSSLDRIVIQNKFLLTVAQKKVSKLASSRLNNEFLLFLWPCQTCDWHYLFWDHLWHWLHHFKNCYWRLNRHWNISYYKHLFCFGLHFGIGWHNCKKSCVTLFQYNCSIIDGDCFDCIFHHLVRQPQRTIKADLQHSVSILLISSLHGLDKIVFFKKSCFAIGNHILKSQFENMILSKESTFVTTFCIFVSSNHKKKIKQCK